MKKEEHKKDTRMTRGMTALYLLLTLVGGVAIVASVVGIQWVHGEEWRARGAKREAGLRTDPARRGTIYSSDGKILATTVTECDLYLDLWKGTEEKEGPINDSCFEMNIDTVCLMLSESMGRKTAQQYKDKIVQERAKEKPRRCFLVERRVPYSTWLAIGRLPGWRGGVVRQVDGKSVVRQVRAHIYGNMAENTIGFDNGREMSTYTGLEGAYDAVLRGQDGVFNCRRLTKGIWLADEPRDGEAIPRRTDDETVDTVVVRKKVDGESIVSTIDTRYQDIAESALRKSLRQYGGSAGCAILMEMKTGYVLACANLAVDTSAHDYREVRDRNVAVSDVYEPGSTFKTVILTAMLNDPAVKIDTSMMLRSGYKNFGGKNGEIKDDHTLEGRDSLNVREVIEQSSNVGMSDLGWRLYNSRRDTLRHLVERMFPYERINPDVKAREYNSYINNLNASNRDFLNFCYGYSTRVSALQLITFYNALGAGGRMVKPLFCKGIMKGSRLVERKPVVLNPSICSRESARMMRTMLEGVVERGTGNNIKNNTYGIAGKTGTAVHSYANVKRYNASFAGFFPSENPRYTCLVVLQDIPYYGRQAALVFKAISDCVVAVDKRLSEGAVKSAWPQLKADSTKARQMPWIEKGHQKELKKAYKIVGQKFLTEDDESEWVTYRQATDSVAASYVPYQRPENRVPNCYGMTAKDAVELLHQAGYKARVRGYGRVKSQQPKGGSAAKASSVVVLEME